MDNILLLLLKKNVCFFCVITSLDLLRIVNISLHLYFKTIKINNKYISMVNIILFDSEVSRVTLAKREK